MLNLLKYELKKIFIYSGVFLNAFFSSFVSLFSIGLMKTSGDFSNAIVIFIIFIPIMIISSNIDRFFKDDMRSGNLEFILSSHEVIDIVKVKFLSILLLFVGVLLSNLLISILVFHTDFEKALKIFFAAFPVIMTSSSVFLILSSIKVFFDRNISFISSMIFPFIIPSLIFYGLYFYSENASYIYISLGISMIFLPICIWLVVNLTRDLYNN